MTKETFINRLFLGFQQNNLGKILTNENAEQLYLLAELLVSTNKQYNLTAITDQDGIILKHFIDSATISELIPQDASVLDVGCGAGFPSLPIAILRKDVRVTSIDSTGKKIEFVNKVAEELALSNIKGICARAEEFASVSRETFEVCTSRAVARLNILSELCIPFIKKNGLFIAMKSSKGKEEYAEASNGISKLGCILADERQITLSLDSESIEREIYVFQKASETPAIYPRNYSQICKKPL